MCLWAGPKPRPYFTRPSASKLGEGKKSSKLALAWENCSWVGKINALKRIDAQLMFVQSRIIIQELCRLWLPDRCCSSPLQFLGIHIWLKLSTHQNQNQPMHRGLQHVFMGWAQAEAAWGRGVKGYVDEGFTRPSTSKLKRCRELKIIIS